MSSPVRHHWLLLLVLLAFAFVSAPAHAQGMEVHPATAREVLAMYGEDTWDSFVAMTYDNGLAGRQSQRRWYTRPLHLTDQHRQLHLEYPGRP
jgi:hypothetical protein